MVDASWAGVFLVVVAWIVLILTLGRPPRCRGCGVRAIPMEGYELSRSRREVALMARCPRCQEVAGRRIVGAYGD